MKLIDLKLQGFIGLQRGMGIDELHLSLAELAGLIAFDGPNGRGKTTVLENMQPFRQFASRRGALKKHCFLKDSQKELTLEYNGDIIRTLIKMDAQTTRSDEGFIWVNDQPIVDGKVSSYDGAIKEIFGSPNLFFWSIFCAQNSKKLTDLTTGKLKELFTEFLRLDRFLDYEDKAKQAAGIVEGIAQAAEASKIRIKHELDSLRGLKLDEIIQREGAKLAEKRTLVDKTNHQIESIKTGIEDAKIVLAKNAERLKLRAAIVADQAAAEAEMHQLEKAWAEKRLDITQRLDDIQSGIAGLKLTIDHKKEIYEADERARVLDELMRKRYQEIDEVRRLQTPLQEKATKINEAIMGANQRVDACKVSQEVVRAETALAEANHNMEVVQAHTFENNPEIAALRAEIAVTTTQTASLTEKDAECVSEKCGLILDALDASKRLPVLQKSLEDCIHDWNNRQQKLIGEAESLLQHAKTRLKEAQESAADQLQDAQAAQKALIDSILPIDEELNDLRASETLKNNEIEDARVELDRLMPLASKLGVVEIALNKMDDYKRREDEISREAAKANQDFNARKAAQNKVMVELDKRLSEIKIDETAKDTLDTLNSGLDAATTTLQMYHDEIKIHEKRLDAATKQKEREAQLAADLKRATAEYDAAQGEHTQWVYLRNACGKKGIQALEIDGVSPTIEAYANDLLISTFGPMNTINFETVDADGKEVLNIVVTAPDGSQTMLENKSGGEAVWILKALRLALTLLSKEKSGRNFQTVLMDEEDGALSAGNAVKFINLYRSMMQIGAFESCYYISHKPEAVGLANHRLVFGDSGVEID